MLSVKENPTIPHLDSMPESFRAAVSQLFEPPNSSDFLAEEWWKTAGQIEMLWLRYRQLGAAFALAYNTIQELETRLSSLEAQEKVWEPGATGLTHAPRAVEGQ